MTPISIAYSDQWIRALVEEYITMQKHDFTYQNPFCW